MELAAVVAVLGLLAGMAATRYGGDAVATGSADGLARRVVLAMQLARRQAIAEGTPAAVVVNRDSGDAVSLSLVRADGADTPIDSPQLIAEGVTLTTAHDRWEFDWTGALSTPAAGGTLTVASDAWSATVTVHAATGHVELAEVFTP